MVINPFLTHFLLDYSECPKLELGYLQWFSVGQNYPTWLPSKFSTTLEPPLIFGKFLQSSAGTTPIYEHLKTMQEMMQHE